MCVGGTTTVSGERIMAATVVLGIEGTGHMGRQTYRVGLVSGRVPRTRALESAIPWSKDQ